MERDSTAILIVDNDLSNLQLLEAVLSGLPAKVIKALSGEEALAQAGQGREFAAILLDVVMPGMDGFETAIRLRQLEALKRTPILFLTALEKDPKEIAKAYHLGAVDYLVTDSKKV